MFGDKWYKGGLFLQEQLVFGDKQYKDGLFLQEQLAVPP